MTLEEKVCVIRDALAGACLRYHEANVFPYLFVDYYSLLLQRDLVFTLWRARRDGIMEPWFTNARDSRLRRQLGGYPWPGKTPRKLRWPAGVAMSDRFERRFGRNSEVALTIFRPPGSAYPHFTSDDLRMLAAVFEACEGTILDNLARSARHRQNAVIGHSSERFNRRDWRREWQSWQERYRYESAVILPFDLCAKLKGDLETYIDDYLGSRATSRDGAVHFCIKQVTGSIRRNDYPHTLRLLVPRRQAVRFEKIVERDRRSGYPFDSRNAGELLDVLRTPLGVDSASIGDACLESGCLQFGQHAGEGLDQPRGAADLDRQRIEHYFYQRLSPKAPIGESKLFYFPIHVNGVPWLGGFSFTGPSGNESDLWQFNYRLYRDVVHELAFGVRAHVTELYLRSVMRALDHFVRQFSPDPTDVAMALNAQLVEMARLCPLPLLRILRSSERDAHSISIDPQDPDWRLVMTENPFFELRVDYGRIEWGEVKNACASFLTDAHAALRGERLGMAGFTAHLFRTPVAKLKTFVGRIDDDESRRAAQKQVRALDAFQHFSEKMLSPERRASLESQFSPTEFQKQVRAAIGGTVDRWHEGDGRRSSVSFKCHTGIRPKLRASYLGSESYLVAITELLVGNSLRHGEGVVHVKMVPKEDLIWLRIINPVKTAEVRKLRSELGAMNSGRAHSLGVATLHLGGMAYFQTRPRFSLARGHLRGWLLQAEMPIARVLP